MFRDRKSFFNNQNQFEYHVHEMSITRALIYGQKWKFAKSPRETQFFKNEASIKCKWVCQR